MKIFSCFSFKGEALYLNYVEVQNSLVLGNREQGIEYKLKIGIPH